MNGRQTLGWRSFFANYRQALSAFYAGFRVTSRIIIMSKFKRFISIVTLICVAVVSSLTVTLCGGTFTQNNLGTGACSFAQNSFNGFGRFNQLHLELGSVFIIVVLIALLLSCLWAINKFIFKK